MAPSTCTRPFSASSAHSHSAAANGSINSYFMDRSGVLGLEAGPSKSDRPLPELLNLLLDAAHQSHESRRALHPPTHAYTLFSQRVAGGSSSTGSGGIGPPPPVGLDASRSLTSLAAHSSVAVYAWGEATEGSQTHPTAPVAAKNAAAAAAPAAAVVAGPASATNASRYPAAATAATAAGPRAAAATASRGLRAPSPTRLSASTSLPSRQFSSIVDTAKAVTKSARTKTGTATATAKPAAAAAAAMAGRTTKAAVTKPAAAPRPTVAKGPAAAGGPCSSQHPHPHPGKKAPTGGSPACGPAPLCRKPLVGEPQARTRGPPAANGPPGAKNAPAAKDTPAGKGVSAAAPKGRSGGADGIADEESEPGVVRRVKSAGSAAPRWSGVAAVGAAVGATEAEAQERGPRQIVRPEVVARALSPWEGAELEVVCLYDSNFQTANRQGQHGVPLRVPVRTHIGPISYLYRWYCKRATQFRTHMTPAELPDAPAMPPMEEPWRSAGGGGDAGVGGRGGSGSATRCGRPASAGSGGDAAAGAGGGAAAAMWLRKATNMRCHGGPGIDGAIGGAGGGAVACEGEAERPATSSGRRLNCSLDPVISLSEVVDLLEDMEIVPQLASRLDITKLFNAAAAAAAPVASSTATAWQAPASGIRRQVAGAAPQRQSCATAAAMAAPAASRVSTSAARQRPTSATATSAGSKNDPRVVSFSAACSGGGTSPASGPRARPSSAPRVLSKPAAAAAAAAAATDATAAGKVIPRTQPHPEEVRFSVFKDVLVRLAVAIACVDPPPTAGGASLYGWGRTISEGEAVAAVRRLLERMQLYRNDVRGLKHRLDQLARMAKEHAVRAAASRMRYVAVPSPVDAAREVAVAPGPAPPPPGARPGLPGWPLPPWGVLAAAPAPPYLTAVLTEEDQGDEAQYRPAWREFGAVALELGVLQPGELRRCRLLLHSRGPHALSVRIDASDAPFCDVSHVGLHSVPYGMPLRVDVTVRLYDLGEVVGELRLRYSSSQDRREREVVVPVYGMVCPPGSDGAAAGACTRPRSASERSAMAAKATREPVTRAVALEALAAAPLGHCGPPRRGPPSSSPPPLSPSSSYLAGYGSISTAEAPPLAPQSSCRGAAAGATAPAAAAAGAVTAAPLATAAQKIAADLRVAEGLAVAENGTADRNTDGDGVDRGAGGVGGGGEAEPPGDASGASPMDGDDGPMGHSRVEVVAVGDIGGSSSGDAGTRSTATAVHVDAVAVIAVPRTYDTGREHGDASGEFSAAASSAPGPGPETDVAEQSAAVAPAIATAKAEGPTGKAAGAAETAEPAVAAAAAIEGAAAACGAVREGRHLGGVPEEDKQAGRVLTKEPHGERIGSPEPASETSGAVGAEAAKGSFFITAADS